MKAMMYAHLSSTTDEVVARLQGKWAADVRAYDRTHRQILHMAAALERAGQRSQRLQLVPSMRDSSLDGRAVA